jgi:hypothetical protein
MTKSFDLTQYCIPVAEETVLADSAETLDIEKTIIDPASSEQHTHYEAHTLGAMTYFDYYFDAPKVCVVKERSPRSHPINFSTSGLIGVGLFGIGAVTGYLLSEVKHHQIQPSKKQANKIKTQQSAKLPSVLHSAKPEHTNSIQFRSATVANFIQTAPSTISMVRQVQSSSVFSANQMNSTQSSRPVIQSAQSVTSRKVSTRRVAQPKLLPPSAIAAPESTNSLQQ